MSGEAALVVAARGGQNSVLQQLLTAPHSPPTISQQATALYSAARAGQFNAVKCLIDFGVNLDVGIPEPPLIAALIGGHTNIALFLIHHGADCDIKDMRGNSCLHLASAAGLYDVVRSLCALGCTQGPNLTGQYPLHVAARNGHISIVRLLCFYGCKLDQRNGDGIRADITALKYGYNNIAELLDKLRGGGLTPAALRSQLLPGNRLLARPQVKLLGHCGAGKSSLAASLKAGLLHALFRRSTSLTTRSRPSSPCQSCQIEMDITPRHNSLSFDSCTTSNYVPTKGVQVHQMDLNGIGDITIWDFSGEESYFQIFHHFLSDVTIPPPSANYSNLAHRTASRAFNSNEMAKYTAANDNVVTSIGKMQSDPNLEILFCKKPQCGIQRNYNRNKYAQIVIYVIMFNLEKPYNIQLQQCIFWLNFIISKLSPCNIKGGLGNVILIGSHADLKAHKTTQGEYIYPPGETLLQSIQEKYHQYFQIYDHVLALDCNASTSVGLRTLKSYLTSVKRSITQMALGSWSGFLENALAWVINIRKSMEAFPVMDKEVFMSNVRSNVNLLASDEHITDIIHHLHVMGEISVIGNLIILCCNWMASILGALFGRDGLQEARILGVYTAHDFQAHFGYCDATQLLELLQELRLCTMCEVDDEMEYEFPCFNLVETLDGLWDPDDLQYKSPESCYGGLKLVQSREITHLIIHIFPHIQVELRNHVESYKRSDYEGGWSGDCDLYQWWHGSKLCWGSIECLFTLNGSHGAEYLDLRIRGPAGSGQTCFITTEKMLQLIYQALGRVAPGLILERYTLSAQQLRLHCDEPYGWSSQHINNELLQHDECGKNVPYSSILLSNPITGKKESLLSLLCFDFHTLGEIIEWCPQIPAKKMSPHLLASLSTLLDPPHPLGTHWCMLAVSLGVSQETIATFDSETDIWHTIKLLKTVNCNIGTLIKKLTSLARTDAVDIILKLAPLYSNVASEQVKLEENKEYSPKSNVSNKAIGSKIHTDV